MKENFLSSLFRSVSQFFVKKQAAASPAAEHILTGPDDGKYEVPEAMKNFQQSHRSGHHDFIKLQLAGDKISNLQTAKWLAVQQQQELYRIDLGKVVSKYIGETEKNLAAIFNSAENNKWLLFFDEADALFGKRSGINNSHDRYANTEANYLLQRIKRHKGTVLISCVTKECLEKKFLPVIIKE